jgi:hypothetical protein
VSERGAGRYPQEARGPSPDSSPKGHGYLGKQDDPEAENNALQISEPSGCLRDNPRFRQLHDANKNKNSARKALMMIPAAKFQLR